MVKKEFSISNFIIHEFKKESGNLESEIYFSEKNDKKNEENNGSEIKDDIDIIKTIHQELTGLSKHTIFTDRNDNIFKKELESYIQNPNIDTFYNFTTLSLNELKQITKKEAFVVGGYYLFMDYLVNGKRYISVVLLRNREKDFGIQFEDNKYKFKKSKGLNLEKISIGFRLNFEIFERRNELNFNQNYIGLITSRSEISQYFIDWVAAANIVKDTENTKCLIDLLKEIDLPMNEDGSIKFERTEFLHTVYNEYRSRKSTEIDLRELSTKIYGEGNKDYIVNFATAKGIQLDSNFKRTSEIWKQLVQVSATVEGIDITIDYNKFIKKEVKINSKKNSLTINNPKIVEQILKQYPNAYRD